MIGAPGARRLATALQKNSVIEVVRLADYAIEEFLNWEAGRPLRYGVTLEMLEIMA